MGFAQHDNASLRCLELKNGTERAFLIATALKSSQSVFFFTVMLVDAPLEEDSTVAHLIKR